MGLWLNESLILNLEKIDAAVLDLAQSGYGIIRVMLRNTNFNHRSPQVVEAVGRIVKKAHEHKVKVALDCEPHKEPLAHDMGSLFPDAIGYRVAKVEATLMGGRFDGHLFVPPGSESRGCDYMGVEAAFLEVGGVCERIDSKLSFSHRVVVEPYRDGFSTNSNTYQEGRPGNHRLCLHMSGDVAGFESGRLIIYAKFFDPRAIDFWSDKVRTYYDMVLESYRGVPLDGLGWDEPTILADWEHYLSGNAFAAAFERINGYKMSDNWALLEDKKITAESIRPRLDYYRTLNEGIFDAQRHFFSRGRELFGNDLILGTHHTWQGEGGINDYRAGLVDYFRLNDNMDAGYTDSWWWDFKSVCYSYTLGSSLGRLSPSGESEINNWDAKPTNSRVAFYSRLMTLMRLNWFNIWYGEATDTCLYPADYTWRETVQSMKRHGDHLKIIGAARPVVEIAMLHGWETVCAINQPEIASAHKTFCLNTAELFVNRNVPFDWIDMRLLSGSTIKNGKLCNDLGSYTILVLPYAAILSHAAWSKCWEFADAGGRIVFVGPPPEFDTEGFPLNEVFSQMLEMENLPLDVYLNKINSSCTLPQYRSDHLDVCYELKADFSNGMTSVEDQVHGIKNKKGNVVYISDLDPRERLLDIIEPWLSSRVICYSDSILWRLYREGDRELVVCIAKEGRTLRGLVRWENGEVEFDAGTVAIIEKADSGLSVHPTRASYVIACQEGELEPRVR